MEIPNQILILVAYAQGHILPPITLAKRLASLRKDLTVTLVTTPLNAKFIRSKVLGDSSKINVIELSFNSSDHGLPPNIENMDDLSIPQIPLLVNAFNHACPPQFKRLLETLIEKQCRPLCVISDFLFGWAVEITRSFTIPAYSLVSSGAFGHLACISYSVDSPRRCSTESDEYTLPGLTEKYRFKISDLPPFTRYADVAKYLLEYTRNTMSLSLSSDGWLFNTVEDIEGIGLELMRNYVKLPVWAVGPLIPTTMLTPKSSSNINIHGQHGLKAYGVSPSECIQWLDLKSQGSVIYISFGSQLNISAFQMSELAKGLEESGHPFIWAIKPPLGFDKNEKFRSEWLPPKYEENVTKTKQGMLIYGWAPQLEILSHKSTGAFLSHCGWNSVLESLSQAVPIIGWPMASDQKYNLAYLMEEMGICVKLAGGLMSVITCKEVSRTIDTLMDKEKGTKIAMKVKMDEIVKKMRASVKNDDDGKGSSIQALDDFISILEEKQKK